MELEGKNSEFVSKFLNNCFSKEKQKALELGTQRYE